MAKYSPEEILARRARREERRAKQREQNIHRARAMHEARIAHDREDEAAVAAGSNPLPEYCIGCSGWYYWHWKGRFYPESIPGSRWFSHYAGRFSTVELNAPFYSWPTLSAVKTWLRQPRRRKFVYTIKVCELITHIKRFAGTKTLVKDFGYIADLLGDRFGCFLFQLPPSFHYTAARLGNILRQLESSRRNVVEFRHRSWWNETVYRGFRDAGVIFCSCSGPRLPDELVKTADEVYVRFHGTKRWYRHDYSKAELAVWTERIRQSGATRVWAYFNNDRDCHSIKNARELRRQLLSSR